MEYQTSMNSPVNSTTKPTDSLRKEVGKSMIDLDMDRPGGRNKLAEHISSRPGRRIRMNSLSRALPGYRETAAYRQILNTAHDILKVMK